MKTVNAIIKILTALATVAGIIYIIATYGDQIVAWAKKMLASCSCKAKVEVEEEAVEETAEEAVEEAVEEPAAEEEPAVEEVVVEEHEPVAEEADFAE